MTKLSEVHSLDLKKILDHALDSERLASIELITLTTSEDGAYSLILQGMGKRNGYSEINIQQINGEVFVKDSIRLSTENEGFQRELSQLKAAWYHGLGGVASGDVRGLCHYREIKSQRQTLSFKVDTEKAHKALWHYMDISAEVMGEFFKGYGTIDLAVSMARKPSLESEPR